MVRLEAGGVVGIFNITFNKKTMFNYKIKHCYDGYTIRNDNWKELVSNSEYSEIIGHVKKQVLENFELEIKFKILEVYRKYIAKLR